MTSLANELQVIAHHEGGHVVAALSLGVPVDEVSLGRVGAGTVVVLDGVTARVKGIVLLAGQMAEIEFNLDACMDLASGDRQLLHQILLDSGATLAELDSWKEAARTLVRQHKPAIAAIAEALVKHGRLTGRQVENIAGMPY
jgi:hypothetical protein